MVARQAIRRCPYHQSILESIRPTSKDRNRIKYCPQLFGRGAEMVVRPSGYHLLPRNNKSQPGQCAGTAAIRTPGISRQQLLRHSERNSPWATATLPLEHIETYGRTITQQKIIRTPYRWQLGPAAGVYYVNRTGGVWIGGNFTETSEGSISRHPSAGTHAITAPMFKEA